MIQFTIGSYDYLVDFEGNIQKKRGRGFMKSFPDRDGYLKYSLCQRGRTFNIILHRLVWEINNGTIPVGMTVDHIDGNKLNNTLDNLQLLSSEENAAKGNSRHWLVISPNGEVFNVYNLSKFCREHGLHAGHMREVAHGYKNQTQCKGWKCHECF